MRVLIVSQYFAPEDARIPSQLAQELARRGHAVEVITSFPSYPAGKLFDGYRQKLGHVETWPNAMKVHRVPTFISHSANPFGRVANYLSFAVSSTLCWSQARRADVVYVYATQMTAALGPFLWRRFSQIPYVLHVQDLWPESVTQSAMVRAGLIATALEKLMKPILKRAYKSAAATIAIAPTMAAMLVERGSPARTTTTVLNWADESPPTDQLEDAVQPSAMTTGTTRARRTAVVYAGNLGPLQDLELVVEAAARLRELPGFTLTIVGSGLSEQSVLRAVANSGATNVRVVGRVPQREMARVYRESDFQLVPLKDLAIFRGTVPSKFTSTLAAGVPVITNITGDVARFVTDHRLGLTAEAGDVDDLERAFRDAHEMPTGERLATASRCSEYYRSEMSMSSGVTRLEEVMCGVTRASRAKRSRGRVAVSDE